MAVQKRDIVIVGGGLSGGLAALALAGEGMSVALVDAETPARMRETAFDGRTTALAYASARVFKRLGLWPDIEPHAEPIKDILVTDGRLTPTRGASVSPMHLHFDSQELRDEVALGYIVENNRLRAALFDRIAQTPEIALHAPAERIGAERTPSRARVELAGGDVIEAQLIVAADGRHSPLRSEAGVKTNAWRYRQAGIVATVRHALPHLGVAQEMFLPSGPFAILPLTDNRSSIVWTETESAASHFMGLGDIAFLGALTERFGDYLGAVALEGPRWSYPLAFHLAQSFVAPRLALIGDAAHAIHPIAGQGFNLGVKDVAALAETLGEALRVGLDVGASEALQNYERWRRFDSVALAFGTDALNRLFSNDLPPLRMARDIGMSIVDRVAPARRFFMRQAGADVGKLPALMAPL